MNFKKTMKKAGRQVWELFKASIPSAIMYFCAGTVLLMLTMKQDEMFWDGTKLTWTLVCGLVAMAYDGLVTYAQGGNAYEMLVSGNMKRVSEREFEGGYKISSHKYAKEYRDWKGFATGASLAAATSSLTWSSAAKADWQSIMVIAADNTSKRLLNLFLDILLTSNQTDCSVSIKRLYIFSTIKVKWKFRNNCVRPRRCRSYFPLGPCFRRKQKGYRLHALLRLNALWNHQNHTVGSKL